MQVRPSELTSRWRWEPEAESRAGAAEDVPAFQASPLDVEALPRGVHLDRAAASCGCSPPAGNFFPRDAIAPEPNRRPRPRISSSASERMKQSMARRSSRLLVLVAGAAALLAVAAAVAVPPTCERIECPAYEVVDSANGFEIRRYTDAMWVSTAAIEDISFVAATRTGFLQ